MLTGLTILELDTLLVKVMQGPQTATTLALAEKIRDAQDQETERCTLARHNSISNSVREG